MQAANVLRCNTEGQPGAGARAAHLNDNNPLMRPHRDRGNHPRLILRCTGAGTIPVFEPFHQSWQGNEYRQKDTNDQPGLRKIQEIT